jgi:putative two-component system response regulator
MRFATGPDILAQVGTVLIVDDDVVSRQFIVDALAGMPGVKTYSFEHGADLLAAAGARRPDLIITDLEMLEVDGFGVLGAMASAGYDPPVPVIVVTASTSRTVRRRALELGAADFLNKPLDPAEICARCHNLINLSRAQVALSGRAAWLADEVERATTTVVAREHETILRLARAAEYRDWETGAHIKRIAEFSKLIAMGMALDLDTQEALYVAAPLHDVGKLGIPDSILRKPSCLSQEEFVEMQRHTVIGHQLLHDSASPLLRLGAEIALTHHERFDGSGYPRALAGNKIPIAGRIVAVADVFDALISVRPYKESWPAWDARAIIETGSGTEFDPDCVAAFIAKWDVLLQAAARLSDHAQRNEQAAAALVG